MAWTGRVVLSEPGCRLWEDVALLSQLPVLAAKAPKLVSLFAAQDVCSSIAIAIDYRIQPWIVAAHGSNSRARSLALLPALCSSTICCRKAAGYGVLVLGI